MSVSIKGFNDLIVPQPDFRAIKTKNGGWIASQTFAVKKSLLGSATISAKFQKGTQLSVIDPDNADFGQYLYIDNLEVTREEAGIAYVRVNLAGYSQFSADPNNPEAGVPTYYLRGSLAEVTLFEHPKFIALAVGDRVTIGGLASGQYVMNGNGAVAVSVVDAQGNETLREIDAQPSAGDAATFANLVATGTTTYLRPSYTWTKVWEAEQPIPDADLNDLGHIAVPAGEPPEANGTRDWLMTSVDMEQAGELFRNRIEWTLSDRGGWDSNIYAT